MSIKERFADFPTGTLGVQFENPVYQAKKSEIDERIQERVRVYEQDLLSQQEAHTKQQHGQLDAKKLTYRDLGRQYGEKVGEIIGGGLGVLLPYLSRLPPGEIDFALKAATLFVWFTWGKCIGNVCGNNLAPLFAKIEPFDPKDWAHQICKMEINCLTKDSYEILRLIGANQNDPDLNQLNALYKILEERISIINQLMKILYTANPGDLSPKDDVYCPPVSPDKLNEEKMPVNSCNGFAKARKSLVGALSGDGVDFYPLAERGAIVLLIVNILELSILTGRLEVAILGYILLLTLLNSRALEEITEDIVHTSPLCKIVLVASPILGITGPLLILKHQMGASITFMAIFKTSVVAMAAMTRHVQQNKRKIDAYFLQGNTLFWHVLCDSDGLKKRHEIIKKGVYQQGVKIAELEKRLSILKALYPK